MVSSSSTNTTTIIIIINITGIEITVIINNKNFRKNFVVSFD